MAAGSRAFLLYHTTLHYEIGKDYQSTTNLHAEVLMVVGVSAAAEAVLETKCMGRSSGLRHSNENLLVLPGVTRTGHLMRET